MQVHEAEKTVATLANASALAVAVVRDIAGTEIADTLRGSPLTQDALHSIVQAKLKAKLFAVTGD